MSRLGRPWCALATLLAISLAAPAGAQPRSDTGASKRVFSVHDADRDGYLSAQEYELVLHRRRQRHAASGKPASGFRPPLSFGEIDANGDQRISEQELRERLKRRLHVPPRHKQHPR